jgi:acetyl esterase/lipase
MNFKYACLVSLVVTLSLGTCTALKAGEKLLENVSYASVLELPYQQPKAKIAYGKDPLQYGLLWLPPAKKQEHQQEPAVVVFIHGGCWLNAYDIKHSYAAASALANAGYAVWSLEYRRSGDIGGGWPGTFEDIIAGIDYLDKLAEHSIDLTKVVLSGHSAGGHLALLAGALKQNISGVIGLAAIADIETYARGENSCQKAAPRFMGGTYRERIQAYDNANPIKRSLHLKSLLLQGDADGIVPEAQASKTVIPHLIVARAGHFDWLHPDSKAFGVFLAELNKVFPNDL